MTEQRFFDSTKIQWAQKQDFFEFLNATVAGQFVQHIKCFGDCDDVLQGGEGAAGERLLDNAHCFYKGITLGEEYFLPLSGLNLRAWFER